MKKSISIWAFFFTFVTLFMSTAFNTALAEQGNVVELKFTSEAPDMSKRKGFPDSVGDFARDVERLTNGKYKIKQFFFGTLLKGSETRRGLLKGMADIGFMAVNFDYSNYQLNSVVELPVLDYPDSKTATRIWKEIIEKFPEVKAEFKGTRILWLTMGLPITIHSTEKSVRIPDDLKGMKIGAFGSNAKMLDELGATPITLSPMELYMAVDRGMVEGLATPYAITYLLRFLSKVPYHNNTVLSLNTTMVLIREQTWNELPPNVQKIFEELAPDGSQKDFLAQKMDHDLALVDAKKLGHTIITNTPEEIAMWKKAVKPLHEEWIAAREKKGLPAKAVYNEVIRLIQEY